MRITVLILAAITLSACKGGLTLGACELDEFPGTCLNWVTKKSCNYRGDNIFSAQEGCQDLGYVECPDDTQHAIVVGGDTEFVLVEDAADCEPIEF